MAPEPHLVEVTDPGGTTRRVRIEGVVELGRETGGILIDDPSVSRRHLRLDGTGPSLIVEDLGSSYGTAVNGSAITGAVTVSPGDVIRVGDSRLVVAGAEAPAPALPPDQIPAEVPAPAPAAAGGPASTARPRGEFEAEVHGGVEVRWLRGTAAATHAPSYARRAAAARKDLAGLGSEAWGRVAVIHLVDPFPDPAEPAVLIVDGAVIDAERQEIWTVATPESPPEDPHRALALLFGAVLPSADDVEHLLEGYALHLAGVEPPDEALARIPLPPVAEAEGELRAAMSLSFAHYLIDREDADTLRLLLVAAAGRLEQTFQELYGLSSTALEEGWQRQLHTHAAGVNPAQFLRLSRRYLRPYRLRQAELFVYMLLSLAFTAAFPFISRRLIDTAIPSGEVSEVLELLVILGLAFMVSLLAGLRENYVSAWISGAVVRDIRLEMFDRVQRLPTSWFGRHQQGEVLQRLFGDVQTVERGLSEMINTGITQTLTLVMSAVIMMTLNTFLGVIVLVAAPLVAIVYRRMASGALERSMAVQEETGTLFSIAAENYTANPVVKAFRLAGRERSRFERGSERVFQRERRLSLFSGFFGLSVNTIVTLLRLSVLGLSGWLIIEGRFTIGGLLAFMTVMGDVLNPVTALTGLGQELQTSMGALVRINEVLETEPEAADDHERPPLPTLSRRIEIRDLTFSYTPGQRALDEVSATIEAGQRVAFVGPSGSGKSTVLRMLMRMYEPESGSVTIDGVDLRSGSLDSLREQSAVVFQESFLFDTTLRENIALGHPSPSDDAVAEAARAAEIDAFVDQLPRGLDSLVGEGGGSLSGGQRQRVAIARALVAQPALLLLDEATSALDPRTERQVNETLTRVAAGRTVVSVTHRLASITDYDRIFVMAEGRLVEQGTHQELVALGGLYAHLWAEQSGQPVPREAPFDAAGALQLVPLFHDLSVDDRNQIATRMRVVTLEPGALLPSGAGEVMIVRSGRGELVTPTAADVGAVTGHLNPGDAFGVSALLGGGGPSLRALEQMTLLMLDDEALRGAAARYPSVAAALEGRSSDSQRPVGGRRLTRATFAGTDGDIEVIVPGGPPGGDPRRVTGTFAAPALDPRSSHVGRR